MAEYIKWNVFMWIMGLFVVVTGSIFANLYTGQVTLAKEREVYKDDFFREIAEVNVTVGVTKAHVENIQEDVKEIKEIVNQ